MTDSGPTARSGAQGKHDERGRGEEQKVVQLLLGQHALDEAVEAGSRRQQDHDDDRDAGREDGLSDREGAEKHGREQGDLGRQAGVASS